MNIFDRRRLLNQLILLLLFVAINTMWGQSRKALVGPQADPVSAVPVVSSSLLQGDTLLPFSTFYDCNFVLYLSDTGGYVAGTNGYGDLEKAQYYSEFDSLLISEIVVWFADVQHTGSGSTIEAVLYDVYLPDSIVTDSIFPGNLLGTASIPMSDVVTGVDTAGLPIFTTFTFPDSVVVPPAFFAGIKMSQVAGDTVAVWTTESYCNTISNAWEKWSDNSWARIDTAWADLRVDMAIFPVASPYSTGGELAIDSPGAVPTHAMLHQNYPNPFNPSTSIEYHLHAPATVSLEIFNVQGQLIKTVVPNLWQLPNRYQISWDGTNQRDEPAASGVYLYKLSTSQGVVETKKMILLR